ncbi:MAG: DinB family protein [Dehalococcoidia bacterium]|nr:DinB family protein [Dehalococcoidia bacterium]
MSGPSPEERARLRAYIVGQAAALPLVEVAAKMRRDGEALCAALEAVPPASWYARPTPGDWSAAELAGHAIEVIERDAAIVAALRAGRPAPAFVPDELGAPIAHQLADAAAFRAAFTELREAFLADLLRAGGADGTAVTIEHPWFGALNWREWLFFMRIHDNDHARYVREKHISA